MGSSSASVPWPPARSSPPSCEAADAAADGDDEVGDGDRPFAVDEPIPSGESIAAELERFLKDQAAGGSGSGSGLPDEPSG